jgi:aminopeptidase N
MYELGLEMANLEFEGPNSAVWMVMEFKFGNWPKFRAKSTMCYFGLLHFRAALSKLAGIVKTSKNKIKMKNIKKSKTFNNKKYEKFKNQKKSKIVKNQRL